MDEHPNPESQPKKEVTREFGLTNLSVSNRVVVLLLTFIIAVMGVYSYWDMPKEQFPEVVIPTIYVRTPYAGTAPFDIENLISRPIEKEINSISEVDVIKSTSVQDYSAVIVEFEPDADSDEALRKVKDAVDRAEAELPTDLDKDPVVSEVNTSEIPVMNINIAGDLPLDELKKHAEKLQDRIEEMSEISSVEMRGAPEKEIKIHVDPHKMQSLKVSFRDIENAIQRENVSLSGGEVNVGNYKRTIRISGEFEQVNELANIIVKHERGNIVYLKDIASAVMGYQDPTSIARADKKPVITLDVIKQSGENLIDASNKIKRILEQAQQNYLPDQIDITTTNDQSERTMQIVNNLESNIMSGVILVVLVLLFFLGLRNALFVGIAIPLSMFMAIMLLHGFGVTLNMVVLFSLILSLGLLVDNGIVVVENIYRLMEEGYGPIQAAKEGTGEVAWAIIASTSTTLVAFLPLAFWSGIVGEFMKYLPITLMIVLASSLFVAIVINPALTSLWMRVQDEERSVNYLRTGSITLAFLLVSGAGYWTGMYLVGGVAAVFGFMLPLNNFVLSPASLGFQRTLMVKVEKWYYRLIRFALRNRNPFYFLGGTILTLVLSFMWFVKDPPPTNFFPDNIPAFINVYVELPVGSDIHHTDSITRVVEERVFETLEPYRDITEVVLAKVGEGASHPIEQNTQGKPSNKSKIMISFPEYENRQGHSTRKIMKEIDREMVKIPGVSISVEKNQMGPPTGKPINMEIKGEDYKKLIDISRNVKEYIQKQNIKGIDALKMDINPSKPELLVDVNRDKARRFGVSTSQIASVIRTALYGKEVDELRQGDEDIPIMLRLQEHYRNSVETLMNQFITFRDQSTGQIVQVPISAIADVRYSTTFNSVKRKNLDRVITLYSDVKEGYNANATVDKIQTALQDFNMPAEYDLTFTGEQKEQAEAQAFLVRALLIALALIILIIVAQFNSTLKPIIIVSSVIFSTIGVLLGLNLFTMNFVIIMTGIGIISLAGVVVNNAIVMVDYIDLMKERHIKRLKLEDAYQLPYQALKQSVIEGGEKRLRPVLLTAITTILGLIPLAMGMNISYGGLLTSLDPNIYFGGDSKVFWGPMAWTVVYGLVFATFLTLVIVPVMYLLAEQLKRKTARFWRG